MIVNPDPEGGLPPLSGMFGGKKKKKKGIGFDPLMMISPLGGLAAQSPKHALAMLSPGLGIANLFGAFK